MKRYKCILAILLVVTLTVTGMPVYTHAAGSDGLEQSEISDELLPDEEEDKTEAEESELISGEPGDATDSVTEGEEAEAPAEDDELGKMEEDFPEEPEKEDIVQSEEEKAAEKPESAEEDENAEGKDSEEISEEQQTDGSEGKTADLEETKSEISSMKASEFSDSNEYPEPQEEEIQILNNVDAASYTLTYEVEQGSAVITGYEGTAEGDLIIPDTIDGYEVTGIGDEAFYSCSGFTGNLKLPSGLTWIGSYAFGGCRGFTGDLELPSGLTDIGYGAFQGCSGFTGDLELPSGLTWIGSYAFGGCRGFTGDLELPSGLTDIGNGAFQGCSGFTGDLKLPSGLTYIGDGTFQGCSGFTGDLKLPSGLTRIGGYDTSPENGAFYGCSGFTGNLELPSGLTWIGNYAFYGCSGFTGNLELPSGLTWIGNYAFYGCRGFTGDLKLPSGLTDISGSAFYGCSGFTGDLELPSGLTYIRVSAFEGCSGFSGNLELPSGLRWIEEGAFYNCSGFSGNLELPSGLGWIEEGAFYNCSGFSGNLELPSGLRWIEEGAFYNCSGFTGNLKLPSGLTEIGDDAFYWCSGFTSIHFMGDCPLIGQGAFGSITAKAYYPVNANGWDHEPDSSWGWNLTWIPYSQEVQLPESVLTGTLEAVDALEFLVTIDGIAYDVTDDFEMNTAMELYVGNDKRVACILKYGKISEMISITDILIPKLRLTVYGGPLVYQDEKFSETQRQLNVAVSCGVEAPYKNSDLKKFSDLSIFCEKFKLSIVDNGLNFGKEGVIVKKSITELEQKVDAVLALGETKYYDFTLNLEDDFVPNQISADISVTGEVISDGYLGYGNCKVNVLNADLQAQKVAEKKEQKELTQKIKRAKESLDNLQLALGSTLNYYFDDKQVKEIKTYLNVWLAEVISSSSISYTKQDKKVRDYVFKKLGINNNAITYFRNTKAVTTVTGMTKYGERSFEFTVDMGSYILGDGNPYVSIGKITYEIKDRKGIPSSIPSEDIGVVTFADMKTFAEKLQDVAEGSVKTAYQEAWGNHANEVADILVDKTIMDLINKKYGSFSNGVYTLFTEPAKSFVKKVYVECPVDVYIYDLEGKLCGSVVNNEVDSSSTDIGIYVEEDRKCIYLCGDDYRINLVGNDTGTMTYRIEEYAGSTTCLRTVEFKEIPLTKGKTYTGFVLEPAYIDNSLYALTSDADKIIRPDTDTYQDTQVSRVYVDGIVMGTSSLNLKEGESALLNAKVTPNDATNQRILWSSDNEDIAGVDRNGSVSAKKAGTARITACSEDGEFEVYCTVTVSAVEGNKPSASDDLNGWVKKDGKWYYYVNNIKQTGWQKVSGKWYYMNGSGAMTTGWQKVSGKWYYMAGSGAMMTGWQKVSGKWYYMNGSGVMTTGWQKVSGKWYYMAGSGAMTTGWQKVSGKWYYMNGSGVMTTGWQKVSGKWYYMNGSGVMTTGWQKVSGKWYYMNSGGDMKTGWLKLGKLWYYLDRNGVMVTTNTMVNGTMNYFNSSGVWSGARK